MRAAQPLLWSTRTDKSHSGIQETALSPKGTGYANAIAINSMFVFCNPQLGLDNETAIIEWYIFNDCFRAFIITHDSESPIIWTSQEEDLEKLLNFFKQYLTTYKDDKKRWGFDLDTQLKDLAEILHFNDILSHIPSHCEKLILIPHRYLHLLPLHTLQGTRKRLKNQTKEVYSDDGYLIELFSGGVSYTPSCQLLRHAKYANTRNNQKHLNTAINIENTNVCNFFAIQNPNQDLKYTDIEVETIAAKFTPSKILKYNEAHKAAFTEKNTDIAELLKNSQHLHFSCHGHFDFESPLKSGLQLAGAVVDSDKIHLKSSRYLQVNDEKTVDLENCLTVAEILQLNFTQCQLVCLSACETGMSELNNSSDEYIGLPSAFIRAGATNIVSSLWAVSDFSTAILMIKFYEEVHQNNNYNISLSLNIAQKWLKSVTRDDFIAWINEKETIDNTEKQEIKSLLEKNNYGADEKPFSKPEYWAAFCAVG